MKLEGKGKSPSVEIENTINKHKHSSHIVNKRKTTIFKYTHMLSLKPKVSQLGLFNQTVQGSYKETCLPSTQTELLLHTTAHLLYRPGVSNERPLVPRSINT